MKKEISTGKVILASAGPGDPELVTVKTAKYLQQAEVVLTDRLVSKAILEQYVKPGALIVEVGKQCRRGVSTSQQTINQLLLQYALQGKFVVRLKGGDASVFSNILDELEVLRQHNIPYEIVPGVSAALGAAAYAGIPLTARGYATAVRFLTYYKSDIVPEAHWQELATTTDTLVFYMSSEILPMVVLKLRAYGIADDVLIAVAEQATTPYQKIHTSSFADFEIKLGDKNFLSPSLVIIGKVVALHHDFAWISNSASGEYYFKPLQAKLEHLKEKVATHVSRA